MSLTRRGKIVVLLGTLAGVLMAVILGGFLYLRSIGVYGASDPTGKVKIQIPTGSSSGDIGEILAREGVIDSAFGWRIAMYLEGGVEDVQAGRYELPQGLIPKDALEALLDQGPLGNEFVMVTIPEGSWLGDFSRIIGRETHISAQAFTKVLAGGRVKSSYLPRGSRNLEGLLFPSTYQVIPRDTALSVVRRLASEFEEQADAVGLDDARNTIGLSSYEAVVVASMVEAESKVDEDRAKISRVILNRIEKGMKLEIDATVYYALGRRGGSLDNSDLATDSPFNTRRFPGIPPGPIGAPGAESLKATVNPADAPWLYYVVIDCDGHHAFSESYDDFLDNVETYRAPDCG